VRGAILLVGLGLTLSACVPPSPNRPTPRPAPENLLSASLPYDELTVWDDQPAMVAEERLADGRIHRVAPGESGIAIARAYGVRWSKIVAANGLTEPFLLKVGQRLVIPGTDPVEAPSMEERAAAFRLNIDDILTGGEPAQAIAVVTLQPAAVTAPKPSTIVVAEPKAFTGSFAWPSSGLVRNRFGPAGEGRFNDGIDLTMAPGASFSASADGVVAFVGDGVAGYGGVILIRHGSGWISAYGRVANAEVTRGQAVKRGDLIGRVGTGAAPLLHFELRRNRKPVDPLKQLPLR
jgi:murein DD-endopeptidase MepM/ murein hydrolase activator NlpD